MPSQQQIEPLDTLLAIVALLFAPGLTLSDRQVGGVLIEHFNRKTGQCDPSEDRIAELIGRDIRTVKRATDALEKAGLFLVSRHGGGSNRNSYEPIWERFREVIQEWRSKLRAAAEARATKLSPPTRHSRRADGDKNVHQTYSKNLQNRTYSQHGRKEQQRSLSPSSGDAACSQAEKRIDEELRRSLCPFEVYQAAYTVVDDATWREAIEAEVLHRGAGARIVVRQLETLALTEEMSVGLSATGPSSASEIASHSTPAESPVRPPKTKVDEVDDG